MTTLVVTLSLLGGFLPSILRLVLYGLVIPCSRFCVNTTGRANPPSAQGVGSTNLLLLPGDFLITFLGQYRMARESAWILDPFLCGVPLELDSSIHRYFVAFEVLPLWV